MCFSAQAPLSPDAVITSEEEDDVQSGPNHQMQWAPDLQWTIPFCLQTSVIQTFTGGHRGKKDSEAPHISDGSIPVSVFVLYFAGLSHCIWWRLTDISGAWTVLMMDLLPQPDITEAELFVFLAIKNTNRTLLMRPTGRLLCKNKLVLHSIIQECDKIRQIFTHPFVFSFDWQQEWS